MTRLRRPTLAALLFGAGFIASQDVSHGGVNVVTVVIAFVIWLNVAFD